MSRNLILRLFVTILLNMAHYRLLAPSPAVHLPRQEHYSPQDQICQIGDLQRSHLALSSRITDLATDVARFNHRLSHFTEARHAVQHQSIQRTVLFARSRAVSALQAGSSEFLRRPTSLCQAETIVQVAIESKETDCTLQEFAALATVLSSHPSVHCTLYPSPYHVQFPSARHTSRLSILFNTYSDICNALQMDAYESEEPLYREKNTHGRELRAIQVLGVELKQIQMRRVLLGHSYPSFPTTAPAAVLHQQSPKWIDRAWDKGYSYLTVPLPAVAPEAPNPPPTGSRVRRRTSRINTTLSTITFPSNGNASRELEARLQMPCLVLCDLYFPP